MKINKAFLVFGIVVLIAGGLLFVKKRIKTGDRVIACTMEAMVCPDGTAVGRTGSQCEFAPCPSAVPQANNQCTGKVTPSLTEGPYYKAGSPQRNNITGSNITDLPQPQLMVEGYVYDRNCQPIVEAWLDFWQANGQGEYDNVGYQYRGHQFTDDEGHYLLYTVVPGDYPGRTPHIHVKLRAKDQSPVITSQLFMPGAAQNQSDSIFDQSLMMQVVENEEQGKRATYNFVID